MDNTYVLTGNGGFCSSDELYHYGVKGMRWGHRKKIDYAGEGFVSRQKTKPPKGAKVEVPEPTRQSTAGIAKKQADDIHNALNTARKVIKKATAGSKRNTETKLDRDRAKAANKLERAKTKRGREKAQADVDRLAKAKPESYAKAHSVSARVNTAMTKIGALYLGDQIFNDGRGTRAAIQAVKGIGMATITAYTMARGGYDIKWYDKHGRRIG